MREANIVNIKYYSSCDDSISDNGSAMDINDFGFIYSKSIGMRSVLIMKSRIIRWVFGVGVGEWEWNKW